MALAVTDPRATGRIYNVAEQETPPRVERIRQIGQVAGWDGEVKVVPNDRLPAYLQHAMDTDQHWVVDTTRIRQELGYAEVVPLAEGLRRTIDWERRHPPETLDPQAFDYTAEDALLASLSGG